MKSLGYKSLSMVFRVSTLPKFRGRSPTQSGLPTPKSFGSTEPLFAHESLAWDFLVD